MQTSAFYNHACGGHYALFRLAFGLLAARSRARLPWRILPWRFIVWLSCLMLKLGLVQSIDFGDRVSHSLLDIDGWILRRVHIVRSGSAGDPATPWAQAWSIPVPLYYTDDRQVDDFSRHVQAKNCPHTCCVEAAMKP